MKELINSQRKQLVSLSERIVVFDIEILNNDPTSICSIGIIEMVNLEIVSTYYSLIRPYSLKYEPVRYHIHHIKPEKLKKEKTFREVWEEISHYFQDTIVVAHDINVDMLHLRETLKRENITYPNIKMSCTNVLAHLLHPQLEKYNLSELAKLYDISFQSHMALEDAKASALILKQMIKNEGAENLKELHMKYHLAFGEMKHNYYRNMISAETVQSIKELPQNKTNDLYHSVVCFTGKLSLPKEIIEEKTRQVSALPANHVTTQTNILVVGKHNYSKVRYGKENKKVLKALKLIRQGQDLKIIHENEYIRLLNEKR